MGADGPSILAKFSSEYLTWIIPPLVLTGEFYGYDFAYGGARPSNLGSLVEWYRYQMITLDKANDAAGMLNFAVRFVLIAQMSGQHKRLVISGKDCYIEFRSYPPAGIRDSKILGAPVKTEVELNNVELLVKAPRGMVKSKTFNVCDRVKLWMDENFDYVNEYENLEYGLAMLKSMGSYRAIHDLEQAIFAINQPEPVKETKFNLEIIDTIRDMWEKDEEPEIKFRDMYDLLVHGEYVTTAKWKVLFGSFPVQEPDKINGAKIGLIIKGLDKFTDYALAEIRKAKQ